MSGQYCMRMCKSVTSLRVWFFMVRYIAIDFIMLLKAMSPMSW